MADPAHVSVVIPAYNEGSAIARVVSALVAAGPWHEIIVVDDGSERRHRRACRRRRRLGRRTPYNKGNGAAVKTGIRRATGEHVLIVDGDGQHCAEDARRLVSKLGEFDLVIGARSATSQANQARRFGNTALNRLRELPHGTGDTGSHFWLPRRTPRVPPRVPAPAAERVLDANDDDAGFHQGRLQRHLRTDRGAAACRTVEDPVCPEMASSFLSSS